MAKIQITASQLLKDVGITSTTALSPPVQRVIDEELQEK
jgi:hypothetical protein